MRTTRFLPLFLVALAPVTSLACGGDTTSGTTSGRGGEESTTSTTSVTSSGTTTASTTSTGSAGGGGNGAGGGSTSTSTGMGGMGGASSASSGSSSASSSTSATTSGSSSASSSSASSSSASSSSASSSSASSSSASSSSASSSASGSSSSGMGGGQATFAVVRVGDGAGTLTSASQPVYIDEISADGAPVGAAISLSTVAGANQPFSLSGTASSEGYLALSTNGKYLSLAGYATAPGLAAVSGTDVGTTVGAVQRVVARVDGMGNVDTTTLITSAFAKNNPRSAVSVDGSAFWVTGASAMGPAGVQYIGFGQAGSTTILAAPNSARTAGIFEGQLYATSGSAGFLSVFAVGTGLPTMAVMAPTLLAGLPTAAQSPYGFVFFDRDATPGPDTLYIADDKAPTAATPGGIQKYTLVGGSWTLQSTFNAGITTGVRGLAGVVTGATVTLAATTTETAQNHVVVFVDDGSMSPMGAIVATAPAKTVFRGIALTPQ